MLISRAKAELRVKKSNKNEIIDFLSMIISICTDIAGKIVMFYLVGLNPIFHIYGSSL